MTVAIGYVRVSTGRQAAQGGSLESQTKRIVKECDRREWWLADVVQEAKSAKTTRRRPAFMEAIARVEAGEAGVLVVVRMDRAFRSIGDFANTLDRAQRKGWQLRLLEPDVDMSTPMGRAMAGMSAVWAQLERELIAQRTREGIAAKRAAGTYRGGRLLPQSQPISGELEARILRHAGQATSQQIADLLDAAGVPTPGGAPTWSRRTVSRVIERARLRGDL